MRNEINKLVVDALNVVSVNTAEYINSMFDVFTDDESEKLEKPKPQNLLANIFSGANADCLNDTKLLIEVLRILGSRIQNLKTILIDVMDFPQPELGHTYPLKIEPNDDGDDVVYKLTTTPMDLRDIANFIKYKYNIPLIINTRTGVDYSCVITPENTPENSKNIGDVIECLRFLSNNLNEICQLLLGHSNN